MLPLRILLPIFFGCELGEVGFDSVVFDIFFFVNFSLVEGVRGEIENDFIAVKECLDRVELNIFWSVSWKKAGN